VDGFIFSGTTPRLIIGLHTVRNRYYPILRQPIHAFDVAVDTLALLVQRKLVYLPFARNLGHQEDFVKTIEMVLFKKEYDKVDKIIINFLTDKMKELEP